MLRYYLLAILLFTPAALLAQQEAFLEYAADAEEDMERLPDLEMDEAMFGLSSGTGRDLFDELSSYNFRQVSYKRRGYDPHYLRYSAGEIMLSDEISGAPPYQALALFQRLGFSTVYGGGFFGPGGEMSFPIKTESHRKRNRIAINLSDKNYRYGLKFSSCGTLSGNGAGYYAALSRRWGRDAYVNGVFTDETALCLSLGIPVGKGGSVSILALAAPSERGVRAAATKECFALTSDNLYNPAWGYFGDKERSARVRRESRPRIMAVYGGKPSGKTTITATVSYEFGRSSQSALSWIGAQNPFPGYYRFMPGYVSDPQDAEAIAELWRQDNDRVTHIDWQELVKQNGFWDGRSIYLIEEVVERVRNIQFCAKVSYTPNPRTDIGTGVRLRRDASRFFKEAGDLLGGNYILNYDYYQIDAGTISIVSDNDMHNPGRRVYAGDRFGYDYSLEHTSATLFLNFGYAGNRLRTSLYGEVGDATGQREGHYEKEAFPDAASYGRSRRYNFAVYELWGNLYYRFSQRYSAELKAGAGSKAPVVRDIFIAPSYRNRPGSNPATIRTISAEGSLNFYLGKSQARLTGYYASLNNETSQSSYYDDMSKTYSNLFLSGTDKFYYGAELSGELSLSKRLSIRYAAAVSMARYGSSPVADIISESDGTVIATGEHSMLKGYALGGSPETTASLEVKYAAPRMFTIGCSANYMGNNYISISAPQRMARVVYHTMTQETREGLVNQERFPASIVLNATFLKSIRLKKNSSMTLFCSIGNILGNRDIIYSGYEQMRMYRSGTDLESTYSLADPRYRYAYGRTCYMSVTYSF